MHPDVYYFNPTCEYAIANGTVSWQPNQLLQKMEAELETLPVFFSNPGDIILVRKPPSERYIYSLEKLRLKNRRFITPEKAFSDAFISTEKVNHLLPWGWSPAAHHFLKPLKRCCSDKFKNGIHSTWNEQYKILSGKNQSLKILRQVVNGLCSDILIPEEMTGIECNSISDIERALNLWEKIMVKAPWSTSGRGLQPVTKKPVHPSVKDRINGMIKEQGLVVAEPFLDKVMDLAFQFKSEKGTIKYLGTSYFETDKKGQYQGNYLNGVPAEIQKRLSGFSETLQSIITSLKNILEKEEYAKKYEGFFGVDTLIYLDENLKLKINPCLEINLRYNMGLLSFAIEKLICKKAKGMFSIYHHQKIPFMEFSKIKQKEFPVEFKEHQIKSGFFPLTDPFSESEFGAYLIV